jgi:hypothetical protein
VPAHAQSLWAIKIKMKNIKVIYIILSGLTIMSSCNKRPSENGDTLSESTSFKNEINRVITISEKNTDLEETENIQRPKKSKILSSKYSLDKIFAVWTLDPNGPHADFELSEKSFFVVDYDGDGDMPYILNEDTITVYYNDFITRGVIKKVTDESLIISWDNNEETNYVKWKQ